MLFFYDFIFVLLTYALSLWSFTPVEKKSDSGKHFIKYIS